MSGDLKVENFGAVSILDFKISGFQSLRGLHDPNHAPTHTKFQQNLTIRG